MCIGGGVCVGGGMCMLREGCRRWWRGVCTDGVCVLLERCVCLEEECLFGGGVCIRGEVCVLRGGVCVCVGGGVCLLVDVCVC